jgi:plasmid stability protein
LDYFVLPFRLLKVNLLDMPTLVIKSLPAQLHTRLKQAAADHRRSLTQEAIVLLEEALGSRTGLSSSPGSSRFAGRRLLPEYEALEKAGAFSGGTDSTRLISDERDAR